MSSSKSLGHRLSRVEERLQMDLDPPMDRLSLIELRRDSDRELMQAIAKTQGEHTRQFLAIENTQIRHTAKLDEHSAKLDEHSAKLDEHSAKLDALQAGVGAITGMLTTLIERGEK